MTSEGDVEPDPESVGRTILLNQLTGRARTRKELHDKLLAKNVPEEIASRLLDRFTDVGLVDDLAFARTWVEQRVAGKGLGRRALSQELRRKGVPDEILEEVLTDLDPVEETEAARLIVQRKLKSMSRLERDVAIRRLVAMLARKGHSPGECYRIAVDEWEAAFAVESVR